MDSFLLKAILVLDLVLIKVSGNVEGDALNALKTNLVDPNSVLQSWDPTLVNPCTWYHVTCNNESSVIHVDLGNAHLSGQLVPQLGQLTKLQYLDLHGNNISGRIPDELGNLTNLETLYLFSNALIGPIPGSLGNLKKLRILRLNHNGLSGDLPLTLTNATSLQVLDLSSNQLKGDVPVNGSFVLFTPISFANNPGLVLPIVSSHKPLTPSSPPSGNSTGFIAGGVGAGAVVLFAASAMTVTWWRRRKMQNHLSIVLGEEDTKPHLRHLKRFSLSELKHATDNFSKKRILGRGGFGKVYKGCLADGSLVAVKRLGREHARGGKLQFEAEVEMTGSMARHRNLLRLRGYCTTPTERLLVYPFMANGSVASWLQGRPKSKPPLDWEIRKHIALGAGRGLAYLHGHCEQKIIHRDVKAANILLDEEFEPVVGDFGLAKLMDYKATHITTAVRGTIGHMAPEYLSTGTSSEKTDGFGYGVTLLELITGQSAVNLAQRANDNNNLRLLDWLKGQVDAELQGEYNEEEVEQLIQVSLLCTRGFPKERPKMSEVVRMLEGDGLAEKWEQWQQEELFQQEEIFHTTYSYANWIKVNSSPISPDRLSGPR